MGFNNVVDIVLYSITTLSLDKKKWEKRMEANEGRGFRTTKMEKAFSLLSVVCCMGTHRYL
jgi:hypothetical protein